MKPTPADLVLYADSALLVINKPAGLTSLPDGYDPDAPHVVSVLAPVYGELWVVHRLDRETSGVLALARTPQAHRLLNTLFEERKVTKVYHALVVGNPDWQERVVALPLRPDGDHEHRTVPDPREGKSAVTRLRVLERFRCRSSDFALLEARPETGRTHQIRVHLASAGFPVAADPLYGNGKGIYLSEIKRGFKSHSKAIRGHRQDFQPSEFNLPIEGERPLMGRLGLHACTLEFIHPITGEPCLFTASYPKDFSAVLNQFRKHRAT